MAAGKNKTRKKDKEKLYHLPIPIISRLLGRISTGEEKRKEIWEKKIKILGDGKVCQVPGEFIYPCLYVFSEEGYDVLLDTVRLVLYKGVTRLID